MFQRLRPAVRKPLPAPPRKDPQSRGGGGPRGHPPLGPCPPGGGPAGAPGLGWRAGRPGWLGGGPGPSGWPRQRLAVADARGCRRPGDRRQNTIRPWAGWGCWTSWPRATINPAFPLRERVPARPGLLCRAAPGRVFSCALAASGLDHKHPKRFVTCGTGGFYSGSILPIRVLFCQFRFYCPVAL
jgi:hypothetical protein